MKNALQPVIDRMNQRPRQALPAGRRDDSQFYSPFTIARQRMYMLETEVTIDGNRFTELTA